MQGSTKDEERDGGSGGSEKLQDSHDQLCNHFAELGLNVSADSDQIKRAYKKQSVRFHPDKH